MSDMDEIADLSAIEQSLGGCLAAIRRKKAELTRARIARGEDSRLVNDHALLRYLERHKGLDLEAVRDEMRTQLYT